MKKSSLVSRLTWLVGGLSLAAFGGGCSGTGAEDLAPDESLGSSDDLLWSPDGTSFWPNGTVRVCFDSALWAEATWRSNVQKWVTEEISPFATVNFTDFTECSPSPGQDWLKLKKWSQSNSNALAFGYVSDNAIMFGGDRESQNVVLHEFGHKLGFAHEFSNPSSSGCLDSSGNLIEPEALNRNNPELATRYDPLSIMSSTYCQSLQTLSAWDRAGLEQVYGRRANSFNAALNGGDASDPSWTGWVSVARNASPANGSNLTLDDVLVGNFVTDSSDEAGRVVDDLLATTGGGWYVSSGGYRPWVQVASSSVHASELLVGDFNGDGISDVARPVGGAINVSNSASSNWSQLNTTSVPKSELLVGDFNNDGRDDLLRVSGGQWYLSSRGSGAFTQVNTSTAPIEDLRVGNFDGSGKDVFYGNGTAWRFSSGATEAWQPLNSSSVPGRNVLIGNFDGSGQDDVFATIGGWWKVSSEARNAWVAVASSTYTVASLKAANFGPSKVSVFKR